MASEHIAWQSVAVGVGFIGIAAYFLWREESNPAMPAITEAYQQEQSVLTPNTIPAYLAQNRPGYAFGPADALGTLGFDGLTLPDGLAMDANGAISGGNYVGGNYVGAKVKINNPGVVNNYQSGNPPDPLACNCC